MKRRKLADGRNMSSGSGIIARVPALWGAALLATAFSGPAIPGGGRLLAAMDVVTIRIVDAPDLTTTARIEPDGTIAFPYLGRIKAAGLTEDELARRIERGLVERKILADPTTNRADRRDAASIIRSERRSSPALR
jgi:protein involved in polysaccharide export with SLBB domain